MSATHTHAERFSLSEHAAEQRRIHRARLAQLRSERAANCVAETASSSEDPSDDTDEEPSDNEELDIDSYYFLQPVPTWQRRALLRAAGVRRIDAVEKDECRDIRASREHCGCGCKGYCDPESCPCSRANVKCQVTDDPIDASNIYDASREMSDTLRNISFSFPCVCKGLKVLCTPVFQKHFIVYFTDNHFYFGGFNP